MKYSEDNSRSFGMLLPGQVQSREDAEGLIANGWLVAIFSAIVTTLLALLSVYGVEWAKSLGECNLISGIWLMPFLYWPLVMG